VRGPAGLDDAGPDEVSFLAEGRYLPLLAETRAGAVLVGDGVESPRPDLALLRCANPQEAFNAVVRAFAPARPRPEPGVHPTAVVDPEAALADGVAVGPLCVVGAGARLGPGVVLHARVTVGANVVIGEGSELFPGVVLYPHVSLGARCVVHAGAVLGADGFGFEPGPEGWTKTPQGGTVVVEDDVEIGANTTIDCARFKATFVGRNAKIDNLVHVGHNCRIGRSALLLAQVGLAGSTHVGDGAILAGKAGIAGHLRIGAGARVGAMSAVIKDVPAGQVIWGYPAREKTRFLRSVRNVERAGELAERVAALERRLAELEGGRGDGP
jgi:UDP-3-O-[3-hydroxymyristoyl] glucosamine N-acyltransferase